MVRLLSFSGHNRRSGQVISQSSGVVFKDPRDRRRVSNREWRRLLQVWNNKDYVVDCDIAWPAINEDSKIFLTPTSSDICNIFVKSWFVCFVTSRIKRMRNTRTTWLNWFVGSSTLLGRRIFPSSRYSLITWEDCWWPFAKVRNAEIITVLNLICCCSTVSVVKSSSKW